MSILLTAHANILANFLLLTVKTEKNKGQKLAISAFDDTDNPTTKDLVKVETDLANFANSLPYIDAIDIDQERNDAIVSGAGVIWLITFTRDFRNNLNNKNLIVTHTPQAPYFSREQYSSGAYYILQSSLSHPVTMPLKGLVASIQINQNKIVLTLVIQYKSPYQS